MQLTRIVDPLNRDTVYAYDNLGRVTTRTDELSQTTTYAYDTASNVTSVKDHQGFTTQYAYDRLDRRTSRRDPRNGLVSVAFDAAGNLTRVTDAALNVTFYEYDRLNRQTADVNQLGGRRTFTYDAVDNLTKPVDRNGRTREWTFDNLDRTTKEEWKNGTTLVRTINFGYDTADQLTSAGDPDSVYAYTYDSLGRVTTSDNNGTPNMPRVILTSAYDVCRPSRKSCREWMRKVRGNDLLQCGGWTAEECSLCVTVRPSRCLWRLWRGRGRGVFHGGSAGSRPDAPAPACDIHAPLADATSPARPATAAEAAPAMVRSPLGIP